jgi:hypothetical protein
MGSGEVGGDGSMQWDFQGNNIKSHNSSSKKPKHQQHKAEDYTDPSDLFFHVTIKLPQDGGQRNQFLNSLAQGLANGQVGQDVTFDLQIEDRNNHGPTKDQIKITWTSLGDSGPGQARAVARPGAPLKSASQRASKKASKKTSSQRRSRKGR